MPLLRGLYNDSTVNHRNGGPNLQGKQVFNEKYVDPALMKKDILMVLKDLKVDSFRSQEKLGNLRNHCSTAT
ncbi:Hypothetical protein POVR1_LOCUS483 [uncultured virus]|nr:Hypothetical protein POVR1_LOCUS483 [uncultured virus]